MKNACLTFDAKAPAILSKELMVEYCHLKVLHNNKIKQTIVEVRNRYYISKIRQFVKKILLPCTLCNKLNSRRIQYPNHSDVPEFRFDDAKPFSSVGVDYLGPIMVLPVFAPHNTLREVQVALYYVLQLLGYF